jgi:transcriptional regulator with XRE-family HTH domain
MSAEPKIELLAAGQRIRALRLERGLSLRGLARRCGVPYYQLSKIEAGTRPIRPPVLAALALFFDVTTDDLLQDVKEALRPSRPAA